jgi:hypothetical protein
MEGAMIKPWHGDSHFVKDYQKLDKDQGYNMTDQRYRENLNRLEKPYEDASHLILGIQ